MNDWHGGLTEKLDAYAAALIAGEGNQWVVENIGEDYARLNLSREQVISDMIGRAFLEHFRHVYVCQSCGRLYVTDPRKEGLVLYCLGDDPPRVDILRRNVEDAGN